MEKRYVRMENVVYIELREGETIEDAEDRFINALPDGIDITSFRSTLEEPD